MAKYYEPAATSTNLESERFQHEFYEDMTLATKSAEAFARHLNEVTNNTDWLPFVRTVDRDPPAPKD